MTELLLKLIMVLMLFILAGNCFALGFAWLYAGYGLNPWVSFPMGIIVLVLAGFTLHKA